MIEFSNVQKKYGKNIVLDKVNFKIERGETVAIVGFSGAGKSVCLRHMIRLTGPDHGSILIDETPLERLNRMEMRQMRSRFGVLFQGAALLQWMNLYDNVALALRERTEFSETEIKRVEQCLDWFIRGSGSNSL